MATQDKNGVLYLEVDEDITSAIDKLGKNTSDSIQVVTAKRSTLFQSVINLRLLKKAADDAGKSLVLVTSDRVSTNLAGRIGVPVATQVGGSAEVPKSVAPTAAAAALADDEIDGGTVGDDTPKVSPKSAAVPVEAVKPDTEPAPETPKTPVIPAAAAASAAKAPSDSKKKSAVPNIGGMQKRILWIGGGILAILLLFALNYYFTTAKVTLYAKGTQKSTAFSFTADPSASQSQPSAGTLVATQLSQTKTLNASVTATGTKDDGTKAGGNVTVSNCTTNAQPLVAGTRFASADGHLFRSTADATVPPASFPVGSCVPVKTSIAVTADANGDSYNIGPSDYTIPGLNNPAVTAKGGQMSGGSSKISKIITQADVDKAKQAAIDANADDAQKDLLGKGGSGQTVIKESIQQNTTKVSANPDVNSQASSGSVSVDVAYTALSVKKSDLSDLVKSQEQEQVGADQEIYDDGSANLSLTLSGKPDASGAMKFSAKAVASIGKKIDNDQLAKDIKGKKYGEAVDIASRQQDIDKAEISISPGWATSLPGIVKHIHIDVKVSSQ